MSNIIERPTGLPGRLGEMACPEGALRSLPIETILDKTWQYMKQGLAEEDGEFPMGDFFYVIEHQLVAYFQNNLNFGSWGYRLSGYMFWEYDRMIIEIEAKRNDLDHPIILGGTSISGWDMADDYNTKSYGWLVLMEELLADVDKKIVNWNSICTKNKPVIYKQPDIQKMIEGTLECFFEYASCEYDHRSMYHDHDDLSQYLENYEFSFDTVAMTLTEICYDTIMYEFGPFSIVFVDHFIDSSKCMVRAMLDIQGVEISPVLFEKVFDLYEQSVSLNFLDNFLRYLFGEIQDSLIKWNRVFFGEVARSANGKKQKSKERRRLVSHST